MKGELKALKLEENSKNEEIQKLKKEILEEFSFF